MASPDKAKPQETSCGLALMDNINIFMRYVMITTYFGEFVDSDTKHSQPLEELTGTVKVHSLNGVEAAFLYSPDDSKKGYTRYDIPSFGKNYKDVIVAVLGRKITKEVNGKTYNKLIVVRMRMLRTTNAYKGIGNA